MPETRFLNIDFWKKKTNLTRPVIVRVNIRASGNLVDWKIKTLFNVKTDYYYTTIGTGRWTDGFIYSVRKFIFYSLKVVLGFSSSSFYV